MDADTMSRYPYASVSMKQDEDMVKIDDKTVICSAITTQAFIETLPAYNISIVEATEFPGHTLTLKELREVRKAQREDKLIELWNIAVIEDSLPKNVFKRRPDDEETAQEFQNEKRYTLQKSTICR